jgi:hypothetical protein
MSVVLTTGDIRANYRIIDTVFAMDSHKEKTFSGADPNKAFQGVKKQLRQACESLGGDAVVSCQFEYRVAVASGAFGGSKQVVEIFAYGTAVKILA